MRQQTLDERRGLVEAPGAAQHIDEHRLIARPLLIRRPVHPDPKVRALLPALAGPLGLLQIVVYPGGMQQRPAGFDGIGADDERVTFERRDEFGRDRIVPQRREFRRAHHLGRPGHEILDRIVHIAALGAVLQPRIHRVASQAWRTQIEVVAAEGRGAPHDLELRNLVTHRAGVRVQEGGGHGLDVMRLMGQKMSPALRAEMMISVS